MFVIGSAAARGPFQLRLHDLAQVRFEHSPQGLQVTVPGVPWRVEIQQNRVRILKQRQAARDVPDHTRNREMIQRILRSEHRPFLIGEQAAHASPYLITDLPEAAVNFRPEVLKAACAALGVPYTGRRHGPLRVHLETARHNLGPLLNARLAVRAAQILVMTAPLRPERADLETLLSCSAAHLPVDWPQRPAL